jgi:phosphoribosylaminoimidazolecarboxamide formyltransferase/IMP cyclohydrolase
MTDLKKMYTTILGDHFPMEMKITFGDQELVYRKKTWKIVAEDGSVDERGVRYGENPDQEAALYELTNGNLMLGDCRFIGERDQGGGHAPGGQASRQDQPHRHR